MRIPLFNKNIKAEWVEHCGLNLTKIVLFSPHISLIPSTDDKALLYTVATLGKEKEFPKPQIGVY